MQAAEYKHGAYMYRSAGRCIVLAHGDRSASDEEFAALVSEIERVVQVEGSARLLVYAAGDGGPNAGQRATLRRLSSLPLLSGIVSDSMAVRAIVTAISWFMKQPVRAFSTQEAAAVLGFLELSSQEQVVMRRLLSEVCAGAGLAPLSL